MKLKSPVRFIIVVVTILVVIWMFYNFIIALQTGEPFSFFGNSKGGSDSVKTFVVAGVDEDGYRTDLILLCQVNRRDKAVNVLQIPRDTKIENKRSDKKINSAYYSGFDVMSKEIEQVTGLRPEHYAMVSFDGFQDIVDAVGGVTVDVPIRMEYNDPAQDLVIDLQPGKQKLDGEKAEMFMRYRKGNDGTGYPDGDIGRLTAQKELYNAVAKKLLSPVGIVRAPAVFSAVKKNTETDFTAGEILGLMKDVMLIGKDPVSIYSVPGEGKYIGGVSYFVHDKTATKKLVQEHFVLDAGE